MLIFILLLAIYMVSLKYRKNKNWYNYFINIKFIE
jgi:hypothetical protein